MLIRKLSALVVAVSCLSVGPSFWLSQASSADAPKVTYIDHVLPILRAKCLSCHNTDKKSGGLDLSNFTAVKTGGGSGEIFDPGNSGASILWKVINHDEEPKMPPNSDKKVVLPLPLGPTCARRALEASLAPLRRSKVAPLT